MKPSQSLFIDIRGLRYHIRSWGRIGAPKLFMLHGYSDVSASFQFVVDALQGDWHVLSPDWRGYGETHDVGADTFWYPDLYGDLDAILRHFQPDEPVDLLGHSMGANIASVYAGLRPDRVSRLINVEGWGLAVTSPDDQPRRYRKWLDHLREDPPGKEYESFEDLTARVRRKEPRLNEERAAFIARHWGRMNPHGKVELATDPALQAYWVNPLRYRHDEVTACWKLVTAPVLWVHALDTRIPKAMSIDPEGMVSRKACFRNRTDIQMPDTGHMVHLERPEDLAVHIEKFLAETPRRSAAEPGDGTKQA